VLVADPRSIQTVCWTQKRQPVLLVVTAFPVWKMKTVVNFKGGHFSVVLLGIFCLPLFNNYDKLIKLATKTPL
jgi:hypothetical protein